ncbi:MAG: phosphotransferase [Candidatus Micrarchaeia archaeon]
MADSTEVGQLIINPYIYSYSTLDNLYAYVPYKLVHGDMKIDNIIVAQNNEIYLIDFEFGNYIFREFDDAYMLLSILQVDSLKANEYLKLVAKDGVSKAKIIFGELYLSMGF